MGFETATIPALWIAVASLLLCVAALLFGQYVPFVALMGFGEATLTGMLLTLLVVYHPAWVATFNDVHYFKNRLDA